MRVEHWRLESVVLVEGEDDAKDIVKVQPEGTLFSFAECKNPECPEHMIVIKGSVDDDTLSHSLVVAAMATTGFELYDRRHESSE